MNTIGLPATRVRQCLRPTEDENHRSRVPKPGREEIRVPLQLERKSLPRRGLKSRTLEECDVPEHGCEGDELQAVRSSLTQTVLQEFGSDALAPASLLDGNAVDYPIKAYPLDGRASDNAFLKCGSPELPDCGDRVGTNIRT